MSLRQSEIQKVSRAFVGRLTEAVSYTAKWLKSSLEKVFLARPVLLLHSNPAVLKTSYFYSPRIREKPSEKGF